MKLSELAIHIPSSIELFEKYNFDYYQDGEKSFKEACEEKGLVFSEIDEELNQLQSSSKKSEMLTLEDMSIDRLIDFINGQHHSNEEEVLNSLGSSIKKLLLNPELDSVLLLIIKKIDLKFADFRIKLKKHCEKEDKILFPHIRKLYDLRHDKILPEMEIKKNFSKNSIQLLENEHIEASSLLREIKAITGNYLVSVNAPKEYQTLMKNLKEFELEFHMHLHIENNILFPKVIALEEQLNISKKPA